jgi:cyclopropane-fatty-acyl-phospholipid synthase
MTPKNRAKHRLESLARLLEHARERLGLDLGFVLWDGSTLPTGLPHDALAIQIADEGVIARLIRSPNRETLLLLWLAKRIDLRNGTLFDLAHLRKTKSTRDFRKALDKRLALCTLLAFLFAPGGAPLPLRGQAEERPSTGDPTENKRNISFHYDISNVFYSLWLDKEMIYTCAYCTDWDNDIDRIQQDKLEMICRKLRLKPGERMLDVGCGWGAVSMYAAQHYGVTTYGVTLSEQQAAYANEKIKRLGLGDRVRIECKDYTKVEGADLFDKIAAIGIQEHIGIDNYPTYYKTIHRLLKRDGLFLHHANTRPSKRSDKAFRKKPSDMQMLTKYIFPGGELDHIGNTVTMLERHGFEVHDVEAWREHYQRTCKLWHDRLLGNYDAAVAEIGEVKTRLWLTYLAGCSIAFERNGAGLYQTLASKRRKGPSGLPPTRADLYR